VSEAVFTCEQRHELDLGAGHIWSGGDNVKAGQGRGDDRVFDWLLLQNQAIDWIRRVLAYAETACGVCLRVQIDDEYSLAVFDEGRAEADCGRCLPDSTLLVAYDENRQSDRRVTRETLDEIGVKLGSRRGLFVPSILTEESLHDHLRVTLRNLADAS
jgi:hypothetical protein